MAANRLQANRKKKRGMAMLISRILRLGALSFLIVALWLLWQGIGLIVGLFRAPSTPPVENQPAVSAPLSGSLQQLDMPALQGHAVVTVDPGHGGFDPGLGDASALEKDIAFSISTKLKQHLENVAEHKRCHKSGGYTLR